MERCIRCGAELPADQARCPACQAPALGGAADEKVAVAAGATFNVPPLCCCCLGPKELETLTPLHVGERRPVMVPVPWCNGCKQRGSIAVLYVIAGMVGLATTLVVVIKLLDESAYGMMGLALLVGLLGGAILGLERAKRLNQRGHVAKCNPVSSLRRDAGAREGQKSGKLIFGHRVFAQEWRRLNPKR